MTVRRNQPARNPREGVLQNLKKERNCTRFFEANTCKLSNGKVDLFICQFATHTCYLPSDKYFMSKLNGRLLKLLRSSASADPLLDDHKFFYTLQRCWGGLDLAIFRVLGVRQNSHINGRV